MIAHLLQGKPRAEVNPTVFPWFGNLLFALRGGVLEYTVVPILILRR